MARRYMIDSILYWAQEYHIDGFRFDLMGLYDVETIKQCVPRWMLCRRAGYPDVRRAWQGGGSSCTGTRPTRRTWPC